MGPSRSHLSIGTLHEPRTTTVTSLSLDLAAPSAALARRQRRGRVLRGLSLTAVVVGLGTLAALLGQVLVEGLPWLSADLLTEYPSRVAERAGLKAALVGTFWLMLVTAAVAVPIGVGAAVYLEEYARPGRLLSLVSINIANLAGVPGIRSSVPGMSPAKIAMAVAVTMAAIAGTGSMKKVTGTSSAVAMVAVRPGIAPTNMPKAAEPKMTSST